MTKFRLTTRKGISRLNLGELLDLNAAAPLKEALQKAVAKGCPLTLDAGSVERLSTPCVQILIAAVTAIEAVGLSCTLLRPSDAFIDSFNDLGLFPVLKQWTIEG